MYMVLMGCIISITCSVLVFVLFRLMKLVGLWRSIRLLTQFRHLGMNYKTPRWPHSMVSSNPYQETRSVHVERRQKQTLTGSLYYTTTLLVSRLHVIDVYCFCSWRNVLRIWEALLKQWVHPWHSCSPVPPRAISIILVGNKNVVHFCILHSINVRYIFCRYK